MRLCSNGLIRVAKLFAGHLPGLPLKFQQPQRFGQGELHTRMPDSELPEVSPTVEAFNRMAASLQEQISRRENADRERLESEAAAASAKLAREMIDSMTDAVIVTDLEGRITQVNRATTSMFGYDEEFLGRTPESLVVEAERSTVGPAIREIMEKGSILNRPFTAVTKRGRRIPVLADQDRLLA